MWAPRKPVHMTKTPAVQFGRHGITVNCIHPGTTRTECTPSLLTARAAQLGVSPEEAERQDFAPDSPRRNAICRMVDAAEVEFIAVFLASDGVAGKGVPEIFPEGVNPLARVERPHRVGPALLDKAADRHRAPPPEQRVIDPALGRIHVEIGRHDIEVAGENRRRAALQKRLGIAREPVEPAQLVIELRARRRVAVRQIEASDDQTADSRPDVAASRLNKDNHQVRAARCPKSGRVHKRLGEIESGTARLKEAVAAWQVCLTSLSPYGRNPECNGCALRFAPGGKPHVGDRSTAAALWRRGDRRLCSAISLTRHNRHRYRRKARPESEFASSSLTHRWRGADSNLRSLSATATSPHCGDGLTVEAARLDRLEREPNLVSLFRWSAQR